jgi:hypothetical protein
MAQNLGRITGIVLNEDGVVVDDATVCLSMTSGNNTGINCLTPTSHGQFQIEKVQFGNYELFAINNAEGYAIENQSPGQKITLTAENPSPNVTIRLRPRGAVLSGTVRDKATGESVKGFRVQYLDVDGKAAGGAPPFTKDGEFHVTLPPLCDLVIIVSAPGYRGWVYTDSSNPSRPVLRLGSGERKVVNVELEPTGER